MMIKRWLAVLLVAQLLVPSFAFAAGNCAPYRSWNTGDTLTASDLTQTAVVASTTNSTPQCLDDYSSDATQMQSITDPYPASVPSLATSTAGELERIRYILKALGGWTQWYAHTEGSTRPTQVFRGLHLRTHPDFASALTKVVLVNADEITMSTGAVVTAWSNLSADITVAGAGGLDTGSEAASTWYEIYAIRKSSDGTKNLLLHRAKDFFNDESQYVNNGQTNLRDASARTAVSQGFQVDTAGPLVAASIAVVRTLTPAGTTPTVYLELRSDDGAGKPSATVLATSDKLAAVTKATGFQALSFRFRTPATVTTATTYHLVVQGTWTIDGANYLSVRHDTGNPYARGTKATFDGATWTAVAADDLFFDLQIERNNTVVTMPAGYDQQAKIGYVYNDSGSNFVPFVARDRAVQPLALQTDTEATTGRMQLHEWSAFLPPVPVTLRVSYGSNSATDHSARLAPNPGGHSQTGYTSGGDGGVVMVWSTDILAVPGPAFPPIVTEYQRVFTGTSTATGTYTITGWEW